VKSQTPHPNLHLLVDPNKPSPLYAVTSAVDSAPRSPEPVKCIGNVAEAAEVPDHLCSEAYPRRRRRDPDFDETIEFWIIRFYWVHKWPIDHIARGLDVSNADVIRVLTKIGCMFNHSKEITYKYLNASPEKNQEDRS
jgi:hypothetical protein